VETVVLKVDPERPDEDSLRYAADVLKRGGLVAFPTETVYGLGALISKREAVKRIFEVKGRPLDNPLIVHVSGVSMFLELVESPPEEVVKLVERFWPGPLTVVWWKRSLVPDEVTAGLSKVACEVASPPRRPEADRAERRGNRRPKRQQVREAIAHEGRARCERPLRPDRRDRGRWRDNTRPRVDDRGPDGEPAEALEARGATDRGGREGLGRQAGDPSLR
jgi:hypothetical protein